MFLIISAAATVHLVENKFVVLLKFDNCYAILSNILSDKKLSLLISLRYHWVSMKSCNLLDKLDAQ